MFWSSRELQQPHGPGLPPEGPEHAFAQASSAVRRVLNAHKRGVAAGSVLTIETDNSAAAYLVLSGWLAISKSMADGGRHFVDLVLPGEIYSPPSVDGNTSPVQIETLGPARIMILPRAVWAALTASDPWLVQYEARSIAAERSRMSERMLRLGKGSAETRIAFALIELWMRLSAIGESAAGVYHLPLTQQALGDFVGLSSVHVCRTMRRLARAGVIAVAEHMNIRILDLGALAGIADVDIEKLRRQIIPHH